MALVASFPYDFGFSHSYVDRYILEVFVISMDLLKLILHLSIFQLCLLERAKPDSVSPSRFSDFGVEESAGLRCSNFV